MIEKTANVVESVTRASLAVVALAVNVGVVWYFYGDAIRKWWKSHVTDWLRRQWADRWEAKWAIDAHGTAADG